MVMENPYEGYACPSCGSRSIETVVTIPRVRGFLVAYQFSSRRFPACASCARTELLKEALLSSLVGWFSITALIANPFLIAYNAIRAPFVGKNYDKVAQLFLEAGIPEPGERVDAMQVLYGLATAMIMADGKVEESEIGAAVECGRRLADNFDEAAFRRTIEHHADLPPLGEYARILGQALDTEQKKMMVLYLTMIAVADDDFDDSEKEVLASVGAGMGMTREEFLSVFEEIRKD